MQEVQEEREQDKQRVRNRRKNKERMKRRARKIYPNMLDAEKLADHIRFCSCQMCQNGRKKRGNSVTGLTIQEYKFLFDESEQRREVDV